MDDEVEFGSRPLSRRIVIAACVAVAIGAGLIAVTANLAAHPGCGARCVPAWALPWPDHRNGSVPQRVLDGAVLAFRHRMSQPSWDGNGPAVLARPRKVIWYAGQVVAHGRLVVIAFEAVTQEGRRLVTGYAPADGVMQGQPGWQRDSASSSESPWVLFDVAAPAPRAGLVIGINSQVPTGASPGQPPTDPLSGDWVIELASPQVTAMSWQVPVGWPEAGQQVRAPARQGMAVARVGQITGTITLTSLTFDHHNVGQNMPVGLPGNAASAVPQLAPPTSPATGSAGVREEAWGQGGSATNLGRGRSVITVICYGPSPVTITQRSTGPGPDIRLGRLPCDDEPHSLIRSGRAAIISWDSSELTAWDIQISGAAA